MANGRPLAQTSVDTYVSDGRHIEAYFGKALDECAQHEVARALPNYMTAFNRYREYRQA